MSKKILISTQDSSVKMFSSLVEQLKKDKVITKSSFVVTNRQFYDDWQQKNPKFVNNHEFIIKEWELTTDYKDIHIDFDLLKEYEKNLGITPGLFGSIVADRRLYMGFNSTYTQDYRRRFSDEDLLKILQKSLIIIDNLFKEFRPDIVISFQCVTIIDYLIAMFARSSSSKYLNLRPTKINNRVMFASTINDPPPEVELKYQQFINKNQVDFDYETEVKNFISELREKNKMYEGVVKPSLSPTQKFQLSNINIKKIVSFISNTFDYFFNISEKDNHVTNPIKRLFYISIYGPLNAKKVNQYLKKKYVSYSKLKSLNYIFFPMHTEPEVSLLVHGKPFVNQIELIRMIAISMPIDKVLIVKEHPWMIGKRSIKAYKKILNIPRVMIAKPNILARDLIINSSLLTVITSSISLEGVILKKPCVTFGDCMTNLLPDFMNQRCKDLRMLPTLLNKMTNTNHNDEWEINLKALLSAIFSISSEVNLYTTLLGRKNRFSNNESNFLKEIENLSDHIKLSLDKSYKKEIESNNLF